MDSLGDRPGKGVEFLHHRGREFFYDLEGAEVVLQLFHAGSAEDYGADVGVFQAPGDGEAREGGAELVGDGGELRDDGEFPGGGRIVEDQRAQPFETGRSEAGAFRHASVVFAGEEPAGEGRPDGGAEAGGGAVERGELLFDAGAVEAGGGGNDGGKPAGGGRSPPTPPPGRFFVTVQWYSRAEGLSHQAIVVSKGPDPRDGFRGVYYVDTSGAAPALNLPNCASQGGCLGDYPSYGLDAHALWVGVNHYTFKTSRLQGAALYGVRKLDLLNETGPAYPAVVAFTEWGGDGARLGFTLQPATPAAGTPPDGRRGGTQYVLASSYFFRTNLSSIVAWAVTNTSLIGAGLPGGAVPSLTPAAVLPALPLRKPARMFKGGLKQAASEQRLDEKDERLQQVVLVRADTPKPGASGAAPSSQPSSYHLWTNMQTAVNVKGGWVSGIAYFRVDPEWRESNAAGASKPAAGAPPQSSSSAWAPVLARNGYVAVPGHHAVNGAVAASPLGAAMALSLLGPGLNYSAAFVRLAPEPVGAVLVPRPAPEPLHGFAAETRNGDFTGACAALDGTLWLAAQCASGTVHVTASGKRQNWATQMVRVDPRGMG